jgi:hypothetical protein
MVRPLVCSVLLILSSCAVPAQEGQRQPAGWVRYEEPTLSTGLRTLPLRVFYDTQGIKINGKKYDAPSALQVIRQAKGLDPSPDILVVIREHDKQKGYEFLEYVSRRMACEQRCYYALEDRQR